MSSKNWTKNTQYFFNVLVERDTKTAKAFSSMAIWRSISTHALCLENITSRYYVREICPTIPHPPSC